MSVSFPNHVALLNEFLARHHTIIDDIERRLLNTQGKAIARTRNPVHVEQVFSSCFFESPGLSRSHSALRGQLLAAHVADGFEAVRLERRVHQLDEIELVARAYEYWQAHRWPGRNGRLAYAQTLYAVAVLRQLEHLALRIWDEDRQHAGNRLREVQHLLDTLNRATSPNTLVRDARWLIQTAQGPLTRHLQPYFTIAEQITHSFPNGDGLEIHKAGAKLAGGHLRSQLHYRALEMNREIDDPDVLAITRNSNSMDAALLVRDLVPVLEAYQTACRSDDRDGRLDLADTILQGVSADPELFLTRLDVLRPSAMIEDVFIEADDNGHARFSRSGEVQLQLFDRYSELVVEVAHCLTEDAPALGPSGMPYSPFGITYGFCADLLSNMALDALHSHPSHTIALEDMFSSRGRLESKHARAEAWERLPQRADEHERFTHSPEWAIQMFSQVSNALHARATQATGNASALRVPRLFAIPESSAPGSLPEDGLPDSAVAAQQHCVTSDLQRALAKGATAFPKSQILMDRKEGRFLASAEQGGKWFGVSKVLLTMCTCQGKDAVITDVPAPLIDVLRLTCPELLTVVSA